MLSMFYSFMPGIGAMDNIHPLFVHFPIALFTSFVLAEFLGVFLKKEGLRSAASYTLYLGTIAALFTVLAGYYAAATVDHSEAVHAIMENHEGFGVTVLIIGALLSLWRLFVRRRFSPKAQAVHLVMAVVLIVVIALGADLGGLMVYKYGVGGEAVRIAESHDKDSGHSHNEDAGHEEGETPHHHSHHHHHHDE